MDGLALNGKPIEPSMLIMGLTTACELNGTLFVSPGFYERAKAAEGDDLGKLLASLDVVDVRSAARESLTIMHEESPSFPVSGLVWRNVPSRTTGYRVPIDARRARRGGSL